MGVILDSRVLVTTERQGQKCEANAYPVTIPIAQGRFDGESQSRGVKLPLADLLIGVTPLELGYSVATGNVRHFQSIPSLALVSV